MKPGIRSFFALGLLLLTAFGCGLAASLPAGPPPVPMVYSNPLFVPAAGPGFPFDQLVDVVDDFFVIDREEPVRQIDDVLTEGRIDTFPEIGSTALEPWRGDSASPYERLESTLQSTRRQATVRVIPTSGGFLVDVAVLKELEDVVKPENAPAGAASLRHDSSIQRYREPVGGQPINVGWIPLGRDAALEQRILGALAARVGLSGQPMIPGLAP